MVSSGINVTNLTSKSRPCHIPLTLIRKGIQRVVAWYVVKRNVQPLIGLPNCLQIKFLSFNKELYHVLVEKYFSFSKHIRSEYVDLFKDGIGKLPVTFNETRHSSGLQSQSPLNVSSGDLNKAHTTP